MLWVPVFPQRRSSSSKLVTIHGDGESALDLFSCSFPLWHRCDTQFSLRFSRRGYSKGCGERTM